MLRDYVQENDASRRELQAFAASLSDDDLSRNIGNGWTVSSTLCHLAFWDRLTLRRLREWQSTGFSSDHLTALGVTTINDAARQISEAVPGREAARLAQENAAAIDTEVARLSDEWIGRIDANGFERVLKRSLHRREHLRRLREALGRA